MTTYDDAVAGWLDALRSGDPVTWEEWRARTGSAPQPGERIRAGATQLELVRRLLLQMPGEPGFADLADRVAATPAIGRGRVEVPLPWLDDSPPGSLSGGQAESPTTLAPDELLRVAVPVLARLLNGLGNAAPATPPVPASRWFGRRFAVHGAPQAAAAVRRQLLGAGWRESQRRAVHVVLTGPIEAVMYDHWVSRVARGSGLGWRRLWQSCETNDRIPARLDVNAIVGELAKDVPADRIHVVVADSPDAAATLAASALRVGDERPAAALATPAVTDLRRRVNQLLTQSASEEERRAAGRRLGGLASDDSAPRLAAPAPRLDWAARTAGRLAERLASTPHPVHGDPRSIATLLTGVRRDVDVDATLRVALGAIAAAWRVHEQAGP